MSDKRQGSERDSATAIAAQDRGSSLIPHRLSLIACAVAALTLTACGNIEPWVKPYEREALADPIMSFDPHPISTSYMHHVFEAREGARGALGSAGGGCGCN
jgi:hypothetical protein